MPERKPRLNGAAEHNDLIRMKRDAWLEQTPANKWAPRVNTLPPIPGLIPAQLVLKAPSGRRFIVRERFAEGGKHESICYATLSFD